MKILHEIIKMEIILMDIIQLWHKKWKVKALTSLQREKDFLKRRNSKNQYKQDGAFGRQLVVNILTTILTWREQGLEKVLRFTQKESLT